MHVHSVADFGLGHFFFVNLKVKICFVTENDSRLRVCCSKL